MLITMKVLACYAVIINFRKQPLKKFQSGEGGGGAPSLDLLLKSNDIISIYFRT